MSTQICPLCSSSDLSDALYKDHKAQITIAQVKNEPTDFPTSPIELAQCQNCKFVFNSAFDKEKTLPVYASQDYVVKSIIPGDMSRNMQTIYGEIIPFVEPNSVILEIGCGQAELARELAKKGKALVTVDPSVQLHLQNLPEGVNHTHINDYFTYERVAEHGPFHLIMFRHLLEHLPEPIDFLKDVARLTTNGGTVYIEVPDWDNVIENERFCDVFNDHFGYFQEPTLEYVMAPLGFALRKSIRTAKTQHMGLFFQKTPQADIRPKTPKDYKEKDFKAFYDHGKKLNSLFSGIDSAVVWGAGAHGQSILSNLSPENKAKIKYYFDKDKNKLNKYIPNTNAKIVYPSKDLLSDIDLVLISAVLYEDEIAKELTNDLKFNGQIARIGNGVNLAS